MDGPPRPGGNSPRHGGRGDQICDRYARQRLRRRGDCRLGGRLQGICAAPICAVLQERETIRPRSASVRYEIAPPHSITSSAVASRFGGTPMPSAFAVLRLISIRILARPEAPPASSCPPQPLVWPP